MRSFFTGVQAPRYWRASKLAEIEENCELLTCYSRLFDPAKLRSEQGYACKEEDANQRPLARKGEGPAVCGRASNNRLLPHVAAWGYNSCLEGLSMWPLSLVFLFALSAPQQSGPAAGQDFRASKLPNFQIGQTQMGQMKMDRMVLPPLPYNASTCFTVRSYVFHRNDGQAPKLVNTTTCTPGNTLRTLQVSPPSRLVPAK